MTRLLPRRALLVQAALLAAAAPAAFGQANPTPPKGNAASGKLAPVAKPAAAKPAVAAAPVAIEWPTKPIRLLIGFPPGSVQDLSARAIAEQLSKTLGQPVIVENKPGASGTIAADQVAKATDLHTFGVMNNSQLTIAKLLNPMAPYDPAVDLAPIALIGTTPDGAGGEQFRAGRHAAGVADVAAQPGGQGQLRLARRGTPGHLGMELIKSRSGGLGVMHVPYQGNPQIITPCSAASCRRRCCRRAWRCSR
jgi:tripartite-type tricarboxylate transporter receptor subunit TctC